MATYTNNDPKAYIDDITTSRANNGKGYVAHGSTAGTARPTGFASIEWSGTVTPTNAQAGDTIIYTGGENFGTWHNTTLMWPAGSTNPTVNLLYFAEIKVIADCTLTGIQYGIAGTAAGNVRCALYNSAGTRVADRTSDLPAGSTYSSQKVPFDSTYAATAGFYFAALLFSNATHTFYGGQTNVPAGQAAQGGFTTPSSVTVPTVVATTPLMGSY